MPSSRVPTGDDLAAFLSESGLPAAGSVQDLDGAAAAGVEAFGKRTGRSSMLPVTQTRLFDLPQVNRRGNLELYDDLLSVSSLTVLGAVKAQNTDFWLKPNDAPMRGKPYQRIQFAFPITWAMGYAFPVQQLMQGISITGQWGYAALLPDEVFRAMLAAGALQLVFGRVDAGDGQGPIPAFAASWEGVSRTTERYDTDFLFKQRAAWQAQVDRVTARYQRVGQG